MNAKVTIIIPFYNCPYVDQALESALAQSYTNVEILLIDDGSDRYTEKITPYQYMVRYIRKDNGGTASALNTGIESATGDYICWLSSDDLFKQEKIERQLAFMQKHHAIASFTNYDIINENNETIISPALPPFVNTHEVYQAYEKYNAINGCTVMIKKELLTQNRFNPAFVYTHDYELWFRLLTSGFAFHFLNENLTQFRQHGNSGTAKYQNKMLAEMAVIEAKYRPLLKARKK